MVEEVVGAGSEFEGSALGNWNFLSQLAGDGEEAWSTEAVWSSVPEIRLLGARGELCRGKARRRDSRTRAAFVGKAGIEKIGEDGPSEGRREIAGDLTVCH